ncbi:MAG: lipopolysaccharide transport periplasmic protein LptA [Candidatus Methylomirabilales bacterium]
MIRLGGWLGCVLLLLCGTTALAAQTASEGSETERPTTVTADHLEVSRKEQKAVYTGDVVAQTPDLTVTADRMEFDFDENMEVVERMVATGNVRIRRRDGTKATSDRATYDVMRETVVLEGHARARQAGNTLTGPRIILYMKEDRQVVEGNENERVTAVIHPKRRPEER